MDRREAVRRYRETPRPAGIFRVRHKPSGRILLGSSPVAPVMLRRIRVQLEMSSHPNQPFQQDWDKDGEDGFESAVVDLLSPSNEPDGEIGEELQVLLELRREKLRAAPYSPY